MALHQKQRAGSLIAASALACGVGVTTLTFVADPPTSPRTAGDEVALRGSVQLQGAPSTSKVPRAALVGACGALMGVLVAVGTSSRRRATEHGQTARRVRQKEEELSDGLIQVLSNTDAYIENDRRSRRPVFAYKDWKKHRSSTRFFRNLSTLLNSTTIRANWKEVLLCTLCATLVVAWNDNPAAIKEVLPADAQSIVDLKLVLPAMPFTLSSAALSLLLVFRTNQAYNRWWEARCIWGAIINTCRDIVRQALSRFDDDQEDLKEEVTRLVSAWPRSLIYHLGERTEISNIVLDKKYGKILTPEEKERLLACTHKPMTCTTMITEAVHRAGIPDIDEMKMDADITKFSDFYGMCERIFKTPIPLSYTRLLSRFLGIWLFFVPLALYKEIPTHWLIVPITALLAYFLFAIEEISVQLEEPFSTLPMGAMADGIDLSIFEALEINKKEVKEKAAAKASVREQVLS